MDQRLTMLMLGVDDLDRARHFYVTRLGWKQWGTRQSRTSIKFMASGVVITLIQRAYLAEESGLSAGPSSSNCVPVINVTERAEVDRVASEIAAAGGTVTSPARMRDGGLYTFYFVDPDGNPWEVVWNPTMRMNDFGVLQISD